MMKAKSKSPFSKSDWAILKAIQDGYYADRAGNVYTPDEYKMTANSAKRSGHLSITLPDPSGKNKCQPVLAHRFVACYFLGVNALLAQCVRHLNDVPNDNALQNLAPGTRSENRRDIGQERLSAIAKQHSASGLVARSRKLSDEQIRSLRKLRAETGESYVKLARKFDVAPMTAYRAITRQCWGLLS